MWIAAFIAVGLAVAVALLCALGPLWFALGMLASGMFLTACWRAVVRSNDWPSGGER